jgi:hypothetical protein
MVMVWSWYGDGLVEVKAPQQTRRLARERAGDRGRRGVSRYLIDATYDAPIWTYRTDIGPHNVIAETTHR